MRAALLSLLLSMPLLAAPGRNPRTPEISAEVKTCEGHRGVTHQLPRLHHREGDSRPRRGAAGAP